MQLLTPIYLEKHIILGFYAFYFIKIFKVIKIMKKIDCSYIYKEEIDKNINMLKHFIESWVKSQSIRNEELFQFADDDFYFYRFAVERQEKAAKKLLTNILWRVLKEYNIPVEYSHDAPFIFIIKENHERIGYRLADFLEDEDINSILKSNHVDKAIIFRTSKGKQTNKLIELENQQYKDTNVNIRALSIHEFYLKQFGEEEYKAFIDSIDNYLNVTKEITGYKSVKFLSKMNLASIKIFEQKKLRDWDYLNYRYQIINASDKKVQNYLYLTQKDIIFENLDDMHKSYIFDKLYETMVSSNEYAASFITSEWLYDSFKGKKNFDYTSVVSGYLKSIEQLLYKIVMLNIDNDCKIAMKRDMLKKAFRQNIPVFEMIDNKFNKVPGNKQGNNYRFTNYPYIEFTEHQKEFMDSSIGTFEYFLRCNKHIFFNPDNAKTVTDMISCFRIECRNGFFHTHNLNDWDLVETIRRNAIYLYFVLLGSCIIPEERKHELNLIHHDQFDELCKKIREFNRHNLYFVFEYEDGRKQKLIYDIHKNTMEFNNDGIEHYDVLLFYKVDEFEDSLKQIDKGELENKKLYLTRDNLPKKIFGIHRKHRDYKSEEIIF